MTEIRDNFQKLSVSAAQDRNELEHKIETNWNGLLWNDYLNCDTSAAQDLWEAEREELSHPADFLEIKTIVEPTTTELLPTPEAKAREELEHKLETNGNGLLWNDYLNCDGSAAQDLWEAEREELKLPENHQDTKQAPTAVEQKQEALEHSLETNWNGLLWNDYLNCDAAGAKDLWAAEREELEQSASPEEEARDPAERIIPVFVKSQKCEGGQCRCQKHMLQREIRQHPEKEEVRLNLHPRRFSLHEDERNKIDSEHVVES